MWPYRERYVIFANCCESDNQFNCAVLSHWRQTIFWYKLIDNQIWTLYLTFVGVNLNVTRMHSSRMRTVRNSSLLPGGGGLVWGGVSAPGGCLLPGGSALGAAWSRGGLSAPEEPGPGGCAWSRGRLLPGGACSGGMVSQHALRQTPLLWTEWQTGVKT